MDEDELGQQMRRFRKRSKTALIIGLSLVPVSAILLVASGVVLITCTHSEHWEQCWIAVLLMVIGGVAGLASVFTLIASLMFYLKHKELKGYTDNQSSDDSNEEL